MSSQVKWDIRFLLLAKHVSSWSKDPSTQCGSVIVRPDNTICSVGFNGFPRNLRDDISFYENKEIKYSRIIHAEMNALLHIKEGVKGYSIYTYPLSPCDRCCVHLLQAGIERFIFVKADEELQKRWFAEKSKNYILEAGKTFSEYDSI